MDPESAAGVGVCLGVGLCELMDCWVWVSS